MQGSFIKPKQSLGLETGNWNYENANIQPRSDAPVPVSDDPLAQAAPSMETPIGIFQPYMFFKIQRNYFFVVKDTIEHGIANLETYLPQDTKQRAGVWRVPYKVIATELPPNPIFVGGGKEYTFHSEPAVELSPEEQIVQETPSAEQVEAIVCAHDALPDRHTCTSQHFMFPAPFETFYAVGWKNICASLRAAEDADFSFAQRIQGLQGATQDAVWSYVDQAQLQRDRSTMLDKFFNGFLQKFLQSHPPSESNKPEHVVAEAVRMYEKMCEKWSVRHVRSVSPKIHAHCEALLNFFHDVIPLMSATDLSIKQWAFLIRRDPKLSPQFTVCLHYFMTKMEQDKGTRNANYKSMNHAVTANIYAMQGLRTLFIDNQVYIENMVREITLTKMYYLNAQIIDWVDVLSQVNIYEEPFKGHKYQIGKEFGMGKTRPNVLFGPFAVGPGDT